MKEQRRVEFASLDREVGPLQQAIVAGHSKVDPQGPAASMMASEQILQIACMDPTGADRTVVVVSEVGGATARDVLAEVAERAVSDNAAKLKPAQGLERHLLVWLDWYAPLGADLMAMSFERNLPGPPPRANSCERISKLVQCYEFIAQTFPIEAVRTTSLVRITVT